MTQNSLLENFPLAQIRADYFSEKLIDRILMMHGDEILPAEIDLLFSLQGELGHKRYKVAMAVLDHLKRTHYIDEIEENNCEWVC